MPDIAISLANLARYDAKRRADLPTELKDLEDELTVVFDIQNANTTITLGYLKGLTTINWGDGTVETINDTTGTLTYSHTYTNIGKYVAVFNGITVIGGLSMGKPEIKEVVIPNSVTTIWDYSFSGASNMERVTIGENVTVIGNSSFSNKKLTTVTIPSKVTTLRGSTFKNNPLLQEIILKPTTPPTIGRDDFDNTNNCPIYVPLQSLSAYKTANNWSSYADRIVGIVDTNYLDAQLQPKLSINDLPTELKDLEDELIVVFDITSANTTVTPKNLKGLTTINWGDGTVETINDTQGTLTYSHTYVNEGKYVAVFHDVTQIGDSAFRNMIFESVWIGDKVISLSGNGCFHSAQFKTIRMSRNCTVLGGEAFRAAGYYDYSTKIQSPTIFIPISVKSIGYRALEGSFFNRIFESNTPPALTSPQGYSRGKVTVPISAVDTYKTAQYWSADANRIVGIVDTNYLDTKLSTMLNDVQVNDVSVVSGTVAKISTMNDNDIQFMFPTEGLAYTSLSGGTAYSCSGIGTATDTDIVVASEYEGLPVTQIGNTAFMGTNISSVKIPNTVTTLGYMAFSETNITECTVPNSVTDILLSGYVFYKCSNLEKLTVNNITNLGEQFVGNCGSLKLLVIGAGVQNVGSHTCNVCRSPDLSIVFLSSTPPTNTTNMIVNNLGTRSFYVPYASIDTYKVTDNYTVFADKIYPLVNTVNELSTIDTTLYTKACVIGNKDYKRYTYADSQWAEVA